MKRGKQSKREMQNSLMMLSAVYVIAGVVRLIFEDDYHGKNFIGTISSAVLVLLLGLALISLFKKDSSDAENSKK